MTTVGYGADMMMDLVDVADYVHVRDDFLDAGTVNTSADVSLWTYDIDSGGSVTNVLDDGSSGILYIMTDGDSGDHSQIQTNGEVFELVAGKPLRFTAEVAVDDADATKMFVGLAVADTDILDSDVERIGFELDGSNATVDCVSDDGTATASNVTSGKSMTDCAALANYADEKHRLSFYWDGVDTVDFYFDGELIESKTDGEVDKDGTNTVALPDTQMAAALLIESQGAEQELWSDYVDVKAHR